MKKYFILLLVLFIIPFKVDALSINGNFGSHNQIMQGDEGTFKFNILTTEGDEFSVEDIKSIDFDIYDSNDEMIYQYHLVDGEWSFVFSAIDVEVGYATLKNFVYVVNDVEYTYDDTVQIKVINRDDAYPTISRITKYKIFQSEMIDAITVASDPSGIGEIIITFVNEFGEIRTYKPYIGSSKVTTKYIYIDDAILPCGLWKIKSITVSDDSIKKNTFTYNEDNFDFTKSFFLVHDSSLRVTDFEYEDLTVVNRYVKENENAEFKVKLNEDYDHVYLKLKNIDEETTLMFDKVNFVKLVKNGDYYVGSIKVDSSFADLNSVTELIAFNNDGSYYVKGFNNKLDNYFRVVDEENEPPILLDYYFDKDKYMYEDTVRLYLKIIDDYSDEFKIGSYSVTLRRNSGNVYIKSSNEIVHYKDDWYYTEFKIKNNSSTGDYYLDKISINDKNNGEGLFKSLDYNKTITIYDYPTRLEVIEVPNKKYAINEKVEIDGFKVNGIFDDGTVFDISNYITIDSLTTVGKQSRCVCLGNYCTEVELEGFIPDIVLSKDNFTIDYTEEVNLKDYVSLDDDRYNFEFTYEVIEGKGSVVNGIFKSNYSGKNIIRVSTKNDVYKDFIINVNKIFVKDFDFAQNIAKFYINDYDADENTTSDMKYFIENLSPYNADIDTLKFESLTPNTLSITEDGIFRLVDVGTAKVRIYDDKGFERIETFTVYRKVTGHNKDLGHISVEVGKEIDIKEYINLTPSNYYDDLTFVEYSDSNYGYSISKDGIIKSDKEGTVCFNVSFYTGNEGRYSHLCFKNIQPITEFDILKDKINIVEPYKMIEFEYKITDTFTADTTINWDYDDSKLSFNSDYCDIETKKCYVSFWLKGVGNIEIKGTTSNGLTDKVTLVVTNPIKNLYVDNTVKTLVTGQSYQFKVDINPSETTDSKVLKWSVSNTSVAKIDQTGKITILKNPWAGQGTVIVTATASNGKSIKITVLVEHPDNVGTVTLKQESTKYIKLSWIKTKGDKYTIYRATSKNGTYKKIGTTSKLYYVDKSVKAGTAYYYKVKNDWTNKYSPIAGFITPPSKTTVTLSTYGFDTLKLKLKKMTGAARYDIYRSTSKNGKYVKVGSTTGTTYYDKKLTYNKTYYYKVKACNKNNICSDYSSYKSKKVTAGKPSITLSSSGATGIKIKYKKVSYATKYQIYRSTSKSKNYKLVKETTSLSFTDKVIPGVTYYYKVRACGGTQCGSYSSVKSKKLTLAKTTISKISLNANKQVTLTYKKIDGAVGYEIYRSTKKSSGYKKIGTTTSTTYIDKPTLGKTYYYKIKVYTKNGTKVIYSSYSSVKSIKVK